VVVGGCVHSRHHERGGGRRGGDEPCPAGHGGRTARRARGSTPGLFGGRWTTARVTRTEMSRFLQTPPDKAAAGADAEGTRQGDLPRSPARLRCRRRRYARAPGWCGTGERVDPEPTDEVLHAGEVARPASRSSLSGTRTGGAAPPRPSYPGWPCDRAEPVTAHDPWVGTICAATAFPRSPLRRSLESRAASRCRDDHLPPERATDLE
jgi:hypothetical protein